MEGRLVNRTETNQLRNFGLMVGGILLIIGLWPALLRSEDPPGLVAVLGGLLVVLGLGLPKVLGPVYRVWMILGHALGWVNTRILLGIVFYGLLTPMGLIMRLFGKDSMRRQFVQEAHTYRIVRRPRPHSHIMRQF